MDLTRYKGKTVEKWTALLPAVSKGDTMSYGVLLVYKKKAIGAYLLEKPSGVVTGLKDAQTAMAMQEATEVSGKISAAIGASAMTRSSAPPGRPWRPRARISAGTGASAMTRS